MSDTSLTTYDKFFLGFLFVCVTAIWIFLVFAPAPTTDFTWYFIVYGPPGWMVTIWLLCGWICVISGLFRRNKNTDKHYRVSDITDAEMEEALAEVDAFLKETI